jgi:hypothetical protein
MSLSEQNDQPTLERLLNYHLGQLAIEERPAVERVLSEQPAWGRRSRRLADVLKLLGSYKVPPAGEDLIQRTLERVAQAGPQAPLTYHPAPEPQPQPAGGGTGRIWFSLRDLVAVAASITLVLGVLVPLLGQARAHSHKVACANRLATLGQGVASYAQANNSQLPVAAGSLLRTTPTKPVAASAPLSPRQRAHLYLVVNSKHVQQPKVFICPANSNGRPMELPQGVVRANFPSLYNCNYSYQEPAGSPLRIEEYPHFPVLADENPYIMPEMRVVGSWPGDNSQNHRRPSGQNVLHVDGSVAWQDSPWCGIDARDNIWQLGSWNRFEPLEGPATGPDAFLFP